MIDKQGKDGNWRKKCRPISLSNVDYKDMNKSITVSKHILENSDLELFLRRIIPQTPSKIPTFMTNNKPVMSN